MIKLKLCRLLDRLNYRLVSGDINTNITKIVHDSREVCEGSVFVCIRGNQSDGHDYISQVVTYGATALVVDREIVVPDHITVIRVEDTRYALSFMAAAYYDYPAEKLKTIGITGTKGKTTTSYVLKEMLELAGYKTGLIGTIEVLVGDLKIESQNTTPDGLLLQQYLSEMVEDGCRCVVMEVSSQGLKLNRVASIVFDYGIFTNISPDHIGPGEHKNYEEYRNCKGKLFRQCHVGVVNVDSPDLPFLLRNHSCTIETYGMKRRGMYFANRPALLKKKGSLGIQFHVNGRVNDVFQLWMPGLFNVYNCLAAIVVAKHFAIDNSKIKQAIKQVKVKGRLEIYPTTDEYTVIIDYAHNAYSLERVLQTIREYRPERIICLFGCGGNRAKSRRYEMGEVSSRYADLTVVTSDNPRDEEMEDIIKDIIIGVKRRQGRYIKITNRIEAIRYCIEHAQPNDVILLAGKGHENYQEIKGIKYHLDEREVLDELRMNQKETLWRQ